MPVMSDEDKPFSGSLVLESRIDEITLHTRYLSIVSRGEWLGRPANFPSTNYDFS